MDGYIALRGAHLSRCPALCDAPVGGCIAQSGAHPGRYSPLFDTSVGEAQVRPAQQVQLLLHPR